MTDPEFDLHNPKIMEDTAVNIKETLEKSFLEFKLSSLFRVRDRSKPESKPTGKTYVDMSDPSAVAEGMLKMCFLPTELLQLLTTTIAVSDIRGRFCTEDLNSKILETLELKAGVRPDYFNSLWMIAFGYPLTISDAQLGGLDGKSVGGLSESDSMFKVQFKQILFDKVEALDKNTFHGNVVYLESFIKKALGQMRFMDAVRATHRLLMSCTDIADEIGDANWNDPSEVVLQRLMDQQFSMVKGFFKSLIQNFRGKDNEILFKNLQMGNGVVRLKTDSPRGFWEKFSKEDLPVHLTDTPIFRNSSEGAFILLNYKGKIHRVVGAELQGSALSLNMNPGEKFKGLSRVFRQITPYMWSGNHSNYFITNFQKTLYFEYPVEDGTWESFDNDNVKLVNSELKYIVINGDENLTFQTFVGIKLFDELEEISKHELVSALDIDLQRLQYHRLHEEKERYNKFMSSLIDKGFKKNEPRSK